MSTGPLENDSAIDPPEAARRVAECGPFGELPWLSHRQVLAERRLARAFPEGTIPESLTALGEVAGIGLATEPLELIWRASGMSRPSLVAQLAWPRLATRVGLGIETPLAHAIIDRMLGFERLEVEGRRQLSPVEWGIGAYLIARGLLRLGETPGPLGRWDLSLDRVGPDPFDARGHGAIVTVRWPARVGPVSGSVRLWLPEALVARWLDTEPPPLPSPEASARFEALTGAWRAEAGVVEMPRGLATLRVGGVLPLGGSGLRGTPRSPVGPVELALSLSGKGRRFWFAAEPAPYTGGGRLVLTAPLRRDPTPREALTLNPSTEPSPTAPSPADVPVTLIVELGRVNLSLSRLADLKPGDVVELGRHSREPVELTSGGRLVARGELVQIDTELGVRVTNLFL